MIYRDFIFIIFILCKKIKIYLNPKTQPNMQTIKVSTTDKGLHHWEQYLLEKQKRRLNKLLIRLETDPWKKRDIFKLFKNKCTNDNIVNLCAHPIKTFLLHLIKDDLDTLIKNSSLTYTL